MEKKCSLKGFAIAVLDHGFVYVGDVYCDDQWCIINNAKNIRYWGTERGLGQLAIDGPTSKTKIDTVGTVRVPFKSLGHLIDTDGGKW